MSLTNCHCLIKTIQGGRIYLDKGNSNITQTLYLHVHRFEAFPPIICRRISRGHRGDLTATRKASREICMRFADWLHSRVDLSEVNISRIWKFSKDETIGL